MRRLPPPPAEATTDAALLDFGVWCRARGVHDSAMIADQSDPPAVAADRAAAWRSWCVARAAHAAEHGWPGGPIAQASEEALADPGEPFDIGDL